MSDSSSTQLYYRPENNWGETPSAKSPQEALREFRFTEESLNFTANTANSEEIRSDRQISDIIRTGVEAGGDVGIEFSFGSHDDLFEGAMYNDWSAIFDSAAVSPLNTLTVAPGSPNTTATITFGSPTIPNLANIPVGAFIELSNTQVSPGNNGFARVTANDGQTLTLSGGPFVAETNDQLRIRASHLRNGVTRKSFLVEKAFTDIGEFQTFTGMRVGSMELNIAPGEILTGQFSFQGRSSTSQSASIIDGLLSPQTIPVSTADVFNAVDNIGNVLIDGAVDPDVCFTEISLNVESNLRNQPCIGQLENSGIGIGRTEVSGTLIAYFVNRNLFDDYLNFVDKSLSFTVALGGNTYLIDIPSFKFTNGEVVAGGNDEDVLVSMEYTARRDPTLGFTVGMNRFGTIPSIVQ